MSDQFSTRGTRHENDWKKTISNSETMFHSGIHVPGGCTISGIETWLKPNQTEGAYWFDDKLMSKIILTHPPPQNWFCLL